MDLERYKNMFNRIIFVTNKSKIYSNKSQMCKQTNNKKCQNLSKISQFTYVQLSYLDSNKFSWVFQYLSISELYFFSGLKLKTIELQKSICTL